MLSLRCSVSKITVLGAIHSQLIVVFFVCWFKSSWFLYLFVCLFICLSSWILFFGSRIENITWYLIDVKTNCESKVSFVFINILWITACALHLRRGKKLVTRKLYYLYFITSWLRAFVTANRIFFLLLLFSVVLIVCTFYYYYWLFCI